MVDQRDMGAAVHGMLWLKVTSQQLRVFTQPQRWCGAFSSSSGARSCTSPHQCPSQQGPQLSLSRNRQGGFEPFPTGRFTQSKESPAIKPAQTG